MTHVNEDEDGALRRIAASLEQIASSLARLAPRPAPEPDFAAADCFVFEPSLGLKPVERVNRVPIVLLKGIDRSRDILFDNTLRFATGLPANNALLWGARGMGKSSLVKAVHAAVNEATVRDGHPPLKLVEIPREDIAHLPGLMQMLVRAAFPILLFCDDLSFDHDDTAYKSLKAALEGGVEGRPDNVLFYATSNRRHLLPRDMIENERSTAINPGEAVEEKVSLSDRFGLWLGFHNCSQDQYLAMIDGYVEAYGLAKLVAPDDLRRQALEWATTRGSRSGRVAHQFIMDLSGRLGRPLRAEAGADVGSRRRD
ncbi:ATP-binding protein [Jiella sonneratiae]|uniref:ATP-binding protein n=1 Tax=Jiella sonneratiae TaxID=2816856 RepID=A0ABS3J7I5_9HYPH|nr:ATP-binding protein [Jiella sonneratiae]MBO0905626.1 ATP-binding protein [Jiella sonneratiae]